MAYTILKSLHGKALGFSSGLDHLIAKNGERFETARIHSNTSSSAATLPNNGLSLLDSSATAANVLIAAPVEGCRAEISIIATSSAVTIDAASSAFTLGTSSTALSFSAADVKNQYVVLRGVSTTRYAVVSGSTLLTLG